MWHVLATWQGSQDHKGTFETRAEADDYAEEVRDSDDYETVEVVEGDGEMYDA